MIEPNEDTRPLSDFTQNPEEVFAHVRESQRPLLLTMEGKPAVIVQDIESYGKLMDEVDRLQAIEAIYESLADIEAGRVHSVEDVFAELRSRHAVHD